MSYDSPEPATFRFTVFVWGNDHQQAERLLGRALADYNGATDGQHPGTMSFVREPG